MNLTKEKCEKALDNITLEVSTMDNEDTRLIESNVDEEINLLDDLIQEHFKTVKENERLQKEEMQHMANGIILTCHIMMSDILCKNDFYNRKVVLNIFSETGITKDEFKNCDDEISKNTIIELFDNEETLYREMGWVK